ncbi:MAG: tetratricopeptide repeat protein [Candidatus Hodarchaeota archaeon]
MAKKSSILKKLNPILQEADDLTNKKNYKEAVRKYREGINFLRLKATSMEDREIEVKKIIKKIDQTYSAEINDVIKQTNHLVEIKEFDEAINNLNNAIDTANNIDDIGLKDSEIKKIKYEISKTDLKVVIEQGKKLKEELKSDNAIEIFKKALNDANEIYSSEPENEDIINIKNLTNQTYSDKIEVIEAQGNQMKQDGKSEEAIKNYENAMNMADKMYESELKEAEISNIKDLINQIHSEKIQPILGKAKELIDQNNPDEAINELKNAINIGNKMFDTNQKKRDFNAIGELINPLLVEKIKPIKERGMQITEEKNYDESVSKVIEAAEIFNNVLKIAKEMVDSEDKNNQLDIITNLIDQTCSAGIKIRKDKGVQYREQKEYEKAISEMYSALSMAKNMACDEDDNVEMDNIKNMINQIYSSEIENILEKGKNELSKKKFEEAREIFNRAMKISNKMYVSDEMEKQISTIKNLLYQSEMKQVVAEGYVTEEQKKFEKELDELNKELERANSITDPESKRKKISDIKHQIDSVYSNQIELLIEQGDLQAEGNKFNKSVQEIDKALKFIDLIEYTVVRDNELKKLISATSEYGNLLAMKNKFEEAFKDYDKALQISELIKDKTIKEEEISKIKLLYEQELDNKVKQDLENGEYDVAIDFCNKAIKLDETYVESYFNMGNAYHNKKDYDKAIEYFNKAVELDPNHVNAWNDMGLAYVLKSEYDNALNSINKALEIDPNYAIAWYRKGNVYKHKNESNQAIESYKKATDLNSDHARAWLFLGSIYYDNKEYDKALEYIEKAIELESEIAKEISPLIKDFKNLANLIQEKLSNLFKNK